MTSEGSTKFCRQCGAKIPRDSAFCEVCGTKLSVAVQACPQSTVNESNGVKPPRTAVSTVSQPPTSQLCTKCGKEMRYSWEAKKWMCDECQLSREAPAPPLPPKQVTKFTFSGIAVLLAVIGAAVFGGLYLEVPAIIIAIYAIHRGEGKPAWTALLVSAVCLVATVFLSIVIGRFL